MKNLIILAIIVLITISCSKEKEEPSTDFISVVFHFNILNKEREDLLNSNTANYYPADSMKLYYLINNEVIEVLDTNMDSPRNIFLITTCNPHRLGIASYDGLEGLISENDSVKTGISITYLELDSTDTDTIKTEWESADNYFINKKVWYNGVLQEHPSRIFEITKDR